MQLIENVKIEILKIGNCLFTQWPHEMTIEQTSSDRWMYIAEERFKEGLRAGCGSGQSLLHSQAAEIFSCEKERQRKTKF